MTKLSNHKKVLSNKRICASFVLIALFSICCVLLCSCALNKTFTVTFIQGDKKSVRVVNKGQNVTNLPFLDQKRGYTVTWDKTNLMNVQKDVTVYAIEIPNTYTITYRLGDVTSAQIADSTQKVTFDETFSLYKPTATGYTFVKWVIEGTDNEFTSGTYMLDADVELVAVWQKLDWSNFH